MCQSIPYIVTQVIYSHAIAVTEHLHTLRQQVILHPPNEVFHVDRLVFSCLAFILRHAFR